MAQRLKALAAMSNCLSLILRIHKMEGDNEVLGVVLWHIRTHKESK